MLLDESNFALGMPTAFIRKLEFVLQRQNIKIVAPLPLQNRRIVRSCTRALAFERFHSKACLKLMSLHGMGLVEALGFVQWVAPLLLLV